MIEVFTTNVQEKAHAEMLIKELKQHFPQSKINIDLHDCDRVLRLEGNDFFVEKVLLLVEGQGFRCKVLD